MEFYLNAFVQLSSTRVADGGPIPWTAIDRYAQRYNVKGPEFDVFIDMIRSMERSQRKTATPEATKPEERTEAIGGSRT